MKKYLLHFLLAICTTGMLLPACQETPAPAPTPAANGGEQADIDSFSAVLTPYDTAKANIVRLMQLQDKRLGGTRIVSYTVRAVDLLGTLGMPAGYADSALCKFKYARVYLGIDADSNFKLYLVPVKGASLKKGIGGTDIRLNNKGIASSDNEAAAGPDDGFVFDLNAPCPNTCASNGPQPPVVKP